MDKMSQTTAVKMALAPDEAHWHYCQRTGKYWKHTKLEHWCVATATNGKKWYKARECPDVRAAMYDEFMTQLYISMEVDPKRKGYML